MNELLALLICVGGFTMFIYGLYYLVGLALDRRNQSKRRKRY